MTFGKPSAITLKLGIAAIALSVGVSQAQGRHMYRLTSGGITGTYYMIAAPLANYVNSHSESLSVTPTTSGGGYENLRRVNSGRAQFGMTQPDTMYQAWKGSSPFKKPLRNWRVIGVVTPPMANHVVALASENIRTAADLKGKRFAIGAPGSGSAVSVMRFLKQSTLSNAVDYQMLPHSNYPDMLINGNIDAFSRLGSVPLAVVNQLSAQNDVVLVDMGEELEQSKFFDKFPYYQPVRIQKGTYPGMKRDITTFGNAGFLIVSKDVPDDAVYEFTKLAYSTGAVTQIEDAFSGAGLDSTKPLDNSLGPVAPGAAKYWREQGVQIPKPVLNP